MKGWPKGKPRKPVQQPKTEEKFNESVGSAGNMGGDTDFSPDERMSVYQEAAKQLYPDDVTVILPETEEKKETEPLKEVITEVKAEGKSSEEITEPKKEETVPVAEPTEPVQATDKKPEDVRTVPYGALHEERMKRKDLQREVDDAKAKMNQLMEDNVKLMTKGKEPSGDEYEPVYKNELITLRQEIQRLQSESAGIKQRFQTEDIRKKDDEIVRLIDKVDQEEISAGRPGFKQYGWSIVATEINKLAQEDPELAETYRNPDGWKLLHAKKFPEIKAIYVSQDKKELFDQKKQAKTGAELVTNTGKAPVKEAPEQKSMKEQWDDYLKMRQGVNL